MALRKISKSQVRQLFSSVKDVNIWEDEWERDLFHIQSKTIRSPRSGCPLEIVVYGRGILKTTMWKGELDPA
jgi:hypothetical protein